MEPAEKFYYSIGEVAEKLNLPISQLRFWSGEFGMQVKKNRKGDRLFQPKDIEMLLEIKKLLKDEGYTIEGARKKLTQKEESKQFALNSENISKVIDMLNEIKTELLELKSRVE